MQAFHNAWSGSKRFLLKSTGHVTVSDYSFYNLQTTKAPKHLSVQQKINSGICNKIQSLVEKQFGVRHNIYLRTETLPSVTRTTSRIWCSDIGVSDVKKTFLEIGVTIRRQRRFS